MLNIPRRELFDIRAQLMTEDDNPDQSSPPVGLSTCDITPNVYEGGFQSWECAVDLASHLLVKLNTGWDLCDREVHVVEVIYALPDPALCPILLTKVLLDRLVQARLFQPSLSSTFCSNSGHHRGVPFIYALLTTTYPS